MYTIYIDVTQGTVQVYYIYLSVTQGTIQVCILCISCCNTRNCTSILKYFAKYFAHKTLVRIG